MGQASTNVASVKYSVDAGGCLTSQNAEAVIKYTNGINMSKTFIWNCAAKNGSTQKQRYEEFFVSSDEGQCFTHYQESSSDAICTESAVAPDSPSFEAIISSLDVLPLVGGSLAGYEVNVQLTNTGNTTLYDLTMDYNDQYSFLRMGETWLFTPPNTTRDSHAGQMSQILPSKSFDVTVTLKMWGGSVLDTKTITVIIP
jgi:hypothetical protein